MSDSDSDFDFNFISGAANKTQNRIRTAISQTRLEVLRPKAPPLETPDKKKGVLQKVKSPKINPVVKSKSDNLSKIDRPGIQPQLEKSISITPPDSPSLSPVAVTNSRRTRTSAAALRGAMRTKKTTKALEKIASANSKRVLSADKDSDDTIDLDEEDLVDVQDHNVTVKIKWQHQIKRIEAALQERLANLFDRFAQEIGEDSSSIIFSLDGKSLFRNQTLASCNIDVSKIMEARHNFSGECKLIQIKLQTKEKRKAKILKMRPTDKFRVLIESYAALTKTGSNQFKFFFDGEQLDPEKTPEDLEFEDGECIDVF